MLMNIILYKIKNCILLYLSVYILVFIINCIFLRDLLFDRLWDGVELIESSCKVYLECLKNYLFEGQFDEVPTISIQKLFKYLSHTNQLEVFNLYYLYFFSKKYNFIIIGT